MFCLAVILYCVWAGAIKPLTLTSTRYGPGYSEAAFRKLRMGSSEREVRASLGPPLAEFTNNAGEFTMIYSFHQSGNLAIHWKSRVVMLSNGAVVGKFSETMID